MTVLKGIDERLTWVSDIDARYGRLDRERKERRNSRIIRAETMILNHLVETRSARIREILPFRRKGDIDQGRDQEGDRHCLTFYCFNGLLDTGWYGRVERD